MDPDPTTAGDQGGPSGWSPWWPSLRIIDLTVLPLSFVTGCTVGVDLGNFLAARGNPSNVTTRDS